MIPPIPKVGRYLLRECIGGGGMGVVYTATHERVPGKTVALKLLRCEEHLPRFRREAVIIRGLEHPNIIPILHFCELEKALDLGGGVRAGAYLVMPYLPNGSLASRLAEGRKTSRKMVFADITRILEELTSALDYAHQHGVIHRDIKPANVLFDAEGRAVLSDFGIALLSDQPRLTATGFSVGTPQYASPEQIIGSGVGPASDLYSLGVVLYEMVTNELPFWVDNPLGWPLHLLHTPPRPATHFRADLPEPSGEVISRALAKRPADRFPDGAALLRAWQTSLAGETITLTSDTRTTRRAAPLRFVGREREMHTLWEQFHNALSGKPVVLMVQGEGGIGKTALVDHFVAQATLQYPKLLVARGEGLSIQDGGGTPFHPFTQIFEQITTQLAQQPAGFAPEGEGGTQPVPEGLRIFFRILCRLAPAALDAFLPPAGFGLKCLLALLEETPLGEQLHWPGFPPGREQEPKPRASLAARLRILDPNEMNPDVLIAQYCQAMVELSREWPIIMVVDALRQVDEDSWQLLEQLSRHIVSSQARILLVGCYRPRELTGELAWTVIERLRERTVSLPVGQDRPQDFVTQFLQANYSHYRFHDEFTKRLTQHTGANPRFLEASLDYLDVGGLLDSDKQRQLANTPAFAALELPNDITKLLQTRVEALQQRPRIVLQHACIQGRVFVRQVLAHTLHKDPPPGWGGRDEIGVSAGVGDELSQVPHLIVLDPPDFPEILLGRRRLTRHAFVDGMTRDHVYSLCDRERQRIIHRWVGEELERLYQGRTNAVAPQLAYHFDLCEEEPWRVLHYAYQVAQVLYKRYDMSAVHDWCDMGLKAAEQLAAWGEEPDLIPGLASPGELEWQLRELKGDAHYFQGEWERARGQYTLLLKRLPAGPPGETDLLKAAELVRKIGETWRSEGNQQRALTEFQRGFTLLNRHRLGAPVHRALLHREIGYVLAQGGEAGQTEGELQHYCMAWDLIKGDEDEWALKASLSTCLGAAFERQVDLEEGEEPTPQQRALLDQALVWHTKAIDLRGVPIAPGAELARDRLGLAGALSNRAIVYEKLCDWEKCESDHRESLRLLDEVGHVIGIAMARLNYGEMLRQRGRHRAAAEQYRGSLQAFIIVNDRFGELIDHFNLSLVEETEALREGHAFRAATIAAVDERWSWLESIASAYLDAHDEGVERETARRKVESFLTDPTPSWSFPESMANLLAPTTEEDHRKLGTLAQDAEWSSAIRAALTGADAARGQ